jgi:predicted nucleic acid-binding protein
MPEYVLDTVVLQVMSFSDPDGVEILLQGLATTKVRFPAEVYNWDRDSLPLDVADDDLSEFARGLRYAVRQTRTLPAAEGARYATWLRNSGQLEHHRTEGSLIVDPLTIEELPRREELIEEYGIGRGEAACLVLVERYQAMGVFLSSDEDACDVARRLGLAYSTVSDVVEAWVRRARPTEERLDALIAGLRAAKFGLKEEVTERLRRLAKPKE